MRRLRALYPDSLVVIGVHSAKFTGEQATAQLREAVMRHGIDHPVVNDADHDIWQQYTVRAWPTLVVVDPQQRIVETLTGEVSAEQLAEIVRPLIDQHEAAGTLDRSPLDAQPEREAEPARPLRYPAKILARPSQGKLYLADTGHHRILEIELDEDGLGGELRRVFGSGEAGFEDGPADSARFHAPHGMAARGDRLYVADTENHALRTVDLATGEVRTQAGTGQKASGSFPLGDPRQTPLRSPWALAAVEHLLFIAMAGSHQVWVLIDERELGPFAGNGREALIDGPRAEASFNQPSDLALGLGHLFVADAEASALRAISLDADPKVFTLVGQGLFEWGDRDGTGAEVRLQHPTGLSMLGDELLIADSYNHKLRLLDPTTGAVKTLAGSGEPGLADGELLDAQLDEPQGLTVAGDRIYIADTNNHRIRVIDLPQGRMASFDLRGVAPPAEARATADEASSR